MSTSSLHDKQIRVNPSHHKCHSDVPDSLPHVPAHGAVLVLPLQHAELCMMINHREAARPPDDDDRALREREHPHAVQSRVQRLRAR